MSYYHLAELIHKRATTYKTRTALKYRDFNEKKWKNLSWKKFSEASMKVAWAMAEMGIDVQENIGIYSQNMYQYLLTEFGAYSNRATVVPIYATASPHQVEYIAKDANIKTLFVGDQFQYNNAFKVQQGSKVLERLIIFNAGVKLHPEDKTSIYFDDFIASGENSEAEVKVSIRMKGIRDTDTACIIYTSGTTGEPKGVVILHSSFIQAFINHDIRLPNTTDKDISMNFLPLAHIFEKAWTYYALHKGMTVAINTDAKEIQKSIKQVRPTIMCSVPRFWEKVYQGVFDKIDSSKGLMKWLYNDAIKTGRKYNLDYKNNDLRPRIGTSIKFHLYNNTIFRVLKMVIGIERGNIFPCAGAPLSDSINTFLQSVNIPIVIGYGLTETTATVCFYPPKHFVLHSVGSIMPNLEVKIGENDEILVKGATVMKEYYNKPQETAEAFTEDGFFKTGDAGELLHGNTIVLKERIKDLFKTSNGKYIAPQAIEILISGDKFIDMITVIGDEVKFVSALIIPNYEVLKQWADEHPEVEYSTTEELLENKIVNAMIASRIEMHQADLAPYEKIKKFTLLPEPFTMEAGELTNTLKIKRRFVTEKYKDVIAKMYEE